MPSSLYKHSIHTPLLSVLLLLHILCHQLKSSHRSSSPARWSFRTRCILLRSTLVGLCALVGLCVLAVLRALRILVLVLLVPVRGIVADQVPIPVKTLTIVSADSCTLRMIDLCLVDLPDAGMDTVSQLRVFPCLVITSGVVIRLSFQSVQRLAV